MPVKRKHSGVVKGDGHNKLHLLRHLTALQLCTLTTFYAGLEPGVPCVFTDMRDFNAGSKLIGIRIVFLRRRGGR